MQALSRDNSLYLLISLSLSLFGAVSSRSPSLDARVHGTAVCSVKLVRPFSLFISLLSLVLDDPSILGTAFVVEEK
jgi:hypothetical protein